MTNLAIYEFMQLATTDGTPRKALITACVVRDYFNDNQPWGLHSER